MENAANIAAGGVFAIAIGILAVVVVIAWILFPILLISKVGKVALEVERLNADQAARDTALLNAINMVTQNTAIIAKATSPQTIVERS